ncbi:MAG: ribulose-phosphate 3-epimerase [Chitinophagaceae bacterium]
MKDKNIWVSTSLLAANFLHLDKECEIINNSEADMLHLDIMDGIFVPNISFGLSIMQQVNTICKKPLDVHLMIVQPERYIVDFAKAGAHVLSVHIEACIHLHRTLQTIKEYKMKTGVALNPHTSISSLYDILYNIDIACLMSVNPGFGGQKFIPHSLKKIEQLKEFILKNNLSTKIEIDGGVTLENYQSIISAGADILVAGTSVFKAKNPLYVIKQMKN